MHDVIDEINNNSYLDYIDTLVKISKLTTHNNSIMFNLKINNEKCVSKIEIIDSDDGEKKNFDNMIFECNNDFYEKFLPELLKKLCENNTIVVKDIVNLDGDEFVAIRLITEYNDLFSIDGLEKGKAVELINLIK